jgi:hypothetical protein
MDSKSDIPALLPHVRLTSQNRHALAHSARLSPPNRESFNHVYGTCVPVEGPSTASKADKAHL